MYLQRKLKNNDNFFQKIKDLDFSLLFCILLLGFISLATMYSTDGGEALFHTKSHFYKLIVFTFLMLIVSFFNIKRSTTDNSDSDSAFATQSNESTLFRTNVAHAPCFKPV